MTDTPRATHAQARADVQARLDGRLTPERQGWLNAHLAGCDECRRYAGELERLEQLLPETFAARWDRPAPNHGAYLPIGGQTMIKHQKLFNYAGLGLGLGALAVLLIGFAFALQTFTLTDSQIPGQAVEATSPTPMFTPPPMMLSTSVRFGEAIALEGYSLIPGEQSVTVELLWRALDTPPGEYAVGVFVMPDGAQSAIPAQSDSVPAGGTRPTSGWVPGEYIVDAHTLLLATELDRVDLVLWVNVYDPNTGERLTSDPPGGGPFNAVSIGMVSMPGGHPPTHTALPFPPDESTPEPYPAGLCSPAGDAISPCTPTMTPTPCEVGCEGQATLDATQAMAATLGWTATPIGFQPTVTPCQVGCEAFWATQTAVALTGTPTPLPTPDLSATPDVFTVQYTVQSGDTLQGIAAYYGVPASVIMDANGMSDPTNISVGQVLAIPLRPQSTESPSP